MRNEDDGSGQPDGEDSLGTRDIPLTGHDNVENCFNIDSLDDIVVIDLKGLSPHKMRKVDFATLDMAYEFYHWDAILNGFAARKSKVIRSKKDDILQQTFVCHRNGFRDFSSLTLENRQR